MCSAVDVEYSGRWSIPNNGITEETLELCALACESDPECTGATWIAWEPENTDPPPNCWFKAWDPAAAAVPCQPTNLKAGRSYAAIITLPTGATDCAAIPYLPDPSIDCVVEKEQFGEFSGSSPALGLPAVGPVEPVAPVAVEPTAVGPVPEAPLAAGPVGTGAVEVPDPDLAALVPPYIAYSGADYSPNQVPAPLTSVENVMTGFLAASIVECATACNDAPTCNSASYYGNNPEDTWPAGATCWLKTLGTPCVLPTDYEVTELPGTIFLLKQDACAAAVPTDIFAPDMAPAMVVPGEAPLMVAPLDAPPLGIAPVDIVPVSTFGPITTVSPAAGPDDTTREFQIGLAPTDAVEPSAEPTLEPITVPVLGTDSTAPGPAAEPIDAGTGLGTDLDGLDGPDDLEDPLPEQTTTVEGEADGVLGLSTFLSTAAAAVAAVCLMA